MRSLMNDYLNLARLGKNDWWRFILAVLIILIAWQLVGATPTLLLVLWVMFDGNPTTTLNPDGSFPGVNINISFTVMMLASWAFIVGIFLAVRFIHQRKLLTLVTPEHSLNWRRLFQGFTVWFLLAVITGIIEALLHPGRYVLTLDLPHLLPFVFLALALIPIQTSAEELFFRGYILQGFGLRIRNIWLLTIISGVIFMLPHFLNPEAKTNFLLMGIYYFSIGAAMAYITLRDGRLELALGMHAANNLFAGLIANAVVTVMPTPSIFTVMELDAVYSTVTALAAILIFVWVFTAPLKRKSNDYNADMIE
jgi:membrane protease YdiL (CAAX protease family)